MAASLLAVPILAGCGGSGGGKPMQHVAGPGFSFEAPGGWRVARSGSRVSAVSGAEVVQVATFRLLKPYSAGLFTKVATELRVRMAAVAGQTGGRLAGSDVVQAAGIQSHSFRVEAAGRIDEYTFVLRGRHEYQLLCRRSSSHGDGVCRRLIQSFAIAS